MPLFDGAAALPSGLVYQPKLTPAPAMAASRRAAVQDGAMTPDRVDALLYDFGGVLVRIHFDRVFARWAQLAGVPMESVASRFWGVKAYEDHECGALDLAGYFAALRNELGLALSDEQFADGWHRVFGAEMTPVIDVARRLAGRIPQYVFSNTNPSHLEYMLRRYRDAFEPFRKVFTSCELGARKPDREAFARVSRDIGVPLERILFFDDTEANVDGARAAGMHAVWVRSPQDVVRAVEPWLR